MAISKSDLEQDELKRLERLKRIDKILDGNLGEDMISKLLNVDNALERTSNPNIAFVLLQVYLRQGYAKFKVDRLKLLADNFGSAMIAYKDRRVDAVKDMMKKAPELVQVSNMPQQPTPEKHGRFFNRKPKEEFE